MNVWTTNSSEEKVPRIKDLAKTAEKVLKAENCKGLVNLIFCDDKLVRDLNKQFRKLDKTTDVLSFIYDEPELLGEVYISVPQAKRQAPKWENSFYRELKRLVVHGSLHISGYKHDTPKQRKEMRTRESFFLG